MQPYRIVEKKLAPDGVPLELVQHGEAWIVRAGGHVLMSSRNHRSERELASVALQSLAERHAARVLIGGLGLGFTLRAVLDQVGPSAEVTVAELVPAVVEWNRTHLGGLADHPMRDPRVRVHEGDVKEALSTARYEVILLDVDNGPSTVAHRGNEALYGEGGSRTLWSALATGGVLAVWSAHNDDAYARRLERAGFVSVRQHPVRAHGARHTIFVAQR